MGATPRGISGSRAAAVLGLSEFTSRFEVWQQIKEEREPGFNAKRGYIMPVFEGNAATRWEPTSEHIRISSRVPASFCFQSSSFNGMPFQSPMTFGT
jgi:hypothetical protein